MGCLIGNVEEAWGWGRKATVCKCEGPSMERAPSMEQTPGLEIGTWLQWAPSSARKRLGEPTPTRLKARARPASPGRSVAA
jgi:hypothetical protein